MNLPIEEQFKFESLKNDQKRAFFSFEKLLKKSILQTENLSKTAAAMANALGGEIYIGLKIEKGKFTGFEQKNDLFPNPELLIKLINQTIEPPIVNLKIEAIGEGFLISIPNSNQKPHRSENYKYYKRILSKNTVMEEFEVRQLYQSAAKSSLKITGLTNLQGIPLMSGGMFEELKFYPRIHIQNLGQKMERFYKLEMAIPSDLVDENFTVLHQYLKGYEQNKNVYSIPSNEVLFQMESKIILELVLKINARNLSHFLNSSIDLKLYSTEQVHEQEYICSEWFHYKGKSLVAEQFVKKLDQ